MNTEADQNSVPETAKDNSRSKDQRRRLLVAALAGAPAIVAGSAQNAYASGTAGSGTN
ncbi:hypothetical protein N9B17_05115 [Rhodopirellula sp.]|nr:hypothetical protein [Rubripirellula sp.]MDA7874529.1 hypothetical protein [Rhodopirellula sp.]MDB4621397.1 hypothetical protein [Rubripirellula sp.]